MIPSTKPNQSNKIDGNKVVSDLNQSKNITLIKNGSGLDKLASEPQLSNKSQKSPENKNSQQKLHDQDMNKIKLLSLTPQRDQTKSGLKKRQVSHTIEFLSGITNMTLNQSIFEFQNPAAVNRRAAKSIFAKDYLQLTENESVVISRVMRYMCALCSKIFQKIFMIEETLLNMMLNPESLETAGDLIRKIEQDLFKTSTVPLLSQTGVPIPQDNCPYCDEPAYLLLNQFICITEGTSQQNVNNNETSVNLEQSPSNLTQLLGKDQLRMITDQTQIIQNYQTLEVNLSGDFVQGMLPSNSAGQNNVSFVIKNQDGGAQVLTISNNAIQSNQVKQTIQMPQHHILKQNVEKLFDCRQQKRKVQIYYLADQKCTSYHSRQKKMQSKSSFKFFSAGGGTGGFEGDEHLAQCEHQHMIPPQVYLPERVQCQQSNKLIMRNILDLKMKKNKSYYEVRNMNTNNNATNFNPVDQLFQMRATNNQQNIQQKIPNERQIPPIKESSSSIGEEGVQQNQPQVGIIGGTNMKLFPKEDTQMAAKVAQLKQQ